MHKPVVAQKRGRPASGEEGQAEVRVLEAATALFMELGFGRTTLDLVAKRAGTGKSTVYNRYGDKAGLFAAVVKLSIEQMFSEMPEPSADGTTIERLRQVGQDLVQTLLIPRCVAFMRITAAEAASFPELASMAYDVSFSATVASVVQAIEPDPAKRTEATQKTAIRFIELAIQPASYQATFGTDIDTLQARCLNDIDDAILLLTAKKLI